MKSKKGKDIFKYNKLLKPICEKLTDHKHRELVGWDESFGTKDNYKYANRHDFYYKCKICGYLYFNHKPSLKDLEYIKEYDKSKGE